MWKKIKDTEYFLSLKHDNDYEIYVTDFVTVWTIFYTEKAFIAQVKDSNKAVELKNDSDYITKGLYLLSNTENLKKVTIRKEDNGDSLFMSLKILQGFLLSFECSLVRGSAEIYFDKITQPLLKTVAELHASQTELRRELENKDKEFKQYQIESEVQHVILRVTMKTKPFDDKVYMEKYKRYSEVFGCTDIPPSLLEKSFETNQRDIVQEPTTAPTIKDEHNIKQESVNIKQEPCTPTLDEPPALLATSTVSCKQEVIKRESSQNSNNDRRKRLKKLNF